MTPNQFKLHCITYLKPLEGKYLYELDFKCNNTDNTFHIENIYFDCDDTHFRCRYNKEINIGNCILIFSVVSGLCRWNHNIDEYIIIEEFVFVDII